jgi:hypothetical protein
MGDIWYERVGAAERLTQGDIIFDCPLVSWSSTPIQVASLGSEVEALKQGRLVFRADVIVMTQACDLEQGKVRNVVVCPHLSLSDYRGAWEAFLRGRGQNPTVKAWRAHCHDIKDGYVWNLTILNRSTVAGLEFEHRIVAWISTRCSQYPVSSWNRCLPLGSATGHGCSHPTANICPKRLLGISCVWACRSRWTSRGSPPSMAVYRSVGPATQVERRGTRQPGGVAFNT